MKQTKIDFRCMCCSKHQNSKSSKALIAQHQPPVAGIAFISAVLNVLAQGCCMLFHVECSEYRPWVLHVLPTIVNLTT